MFLYFSFFFFFSSFHASLRPGDLTEPDRQHSHCAAETCPEQRSTCEVGFRDKVRIKKSSSDQKEQASTEEKKKKNPKSKSLCLSIPGREGMLPGNSAPCCMCLIFRALFVLLVLILCGRGSGAFEDEITEPAAAMASSRISFLYTSFHVPGCPPRAPAASGRLRNCFSCLISHLWGKSRVLPKRQVVGQRLSVCFTRRHCRLLAAHSFIFCCYLRRREPSPKLVLVAGSPTEVSSFCRSGHHSSFIHR